MCVSMSTFLNNLILFVCHLGQLLVCACLILFQNIFGLFFLFVFYKNIYKNVAIFNLVERLVFVTVDYIIN